MTGGNWLGLHKLGGEMMNDGRRRQPPPGVSLDQYMIYLRLLNEYTALAAQ